MSKYHQHLIAVITVLALYINNVQGKNCFAKGAEELDFLYRRADYSGNYSSVKEYWFTKDTTCDFISDQAIKVSWYSSDISVKYDLSYSENEDLSGCEAEDDMKPYIKDTPIGIDDGNETDLGYICKVKFILRNKNQKHDLRV